MSGTARLMQRFDLHCRFTEMLTATPGWGAGGVLFAYECCTSGLLSK